MLPIAGMKVESCVLMRNLVPHGVFEGATIDKRHSRVLEWFEER